jgi:hypothetical protein
MHSAQSSRWAEEPVDLSHVSDVERRLLDIHFEVRMSELRIREVIAERDRFWRKVVVDGVPILCNLLAQLAPAAPRSRVREEGMNGPGGTLPDPGLAPQPVDVDQYRAYAPEKFELLNGYLFYGSEDRLKLLRLLFVNVGLREVVRLLPEDRWREALDAVYGGGR